VENTIASEHKRRRMAIRLIGAAILCPGLFSAFLAPLEIYCFYLFSEGGAFHYDGFRFGSFMFGNLAAQILGYYFLAAVLIPVGYGTLTLKGWARHLTLASVRFWIVAGVPLILAFFFVLLSSKQLSPPLVILIAILAGASCLLLPWLVMRFYESPETVLSFGTQGQKESWIEAIPIPALALAYVFLFFGTCPARPDLLQWAISSVRALDFGPRRHHAIGRLHHPAPGDIVGHVASQAVGMVVRIGILLPHVDVIRHHTAILQLDGHAISAQSSSV